MNSLSRRVVLVAASIAVLLPSGTAAAAPCWRPPVNATITDPFREPACPWCPGNRGIEYGTPRGTRVLAVGTGRVTWAGAIAGTVYVIVRHGDGRRITYGNLADESFDSGDLVRRGDLVGRSAGRFHFGVREGDRYVDPAPFLGRLVHRVRLVPLDGRGANPAPRPRLVCAR